MKHLIIYEIVGSCEVETEHDNLLDVLAWRREIAKRHNIKDERQVVITNAIKLPLE